MANHRGGHEKQAPESLGAWFFKELKFALADIRHKVVEEATYGRTTTPHWREPVTAPPADGGIHGKADTSAKETGGVHGKLDAPAPDAGGGIHGKTERAPKDNGPAGPGTPALSEPKGLGMSYAELTAGWEKAAQSDRAAGREREPEREPAIER